MAANGQDFLLCWYSVIRQPEPKLNKVNAVDVIFSCSILFVQPGLQMISEWDDENILFSQHSSKPNVGGSDYKTLFRCRRSFVNPIKNEFTFCKKPVIISANVSVIITDAHYHQHSFSIF